MHRLLVFDLDGTLAQVGKGMLPEDVEKLIELEKEGYIIAICSGKPSYYLCGFARQIGLQNPILVGENGATIQFGIELPPKCYVVHPYSERAKLQRNRMRELIDGKFGNKIWYQPNEVGLSPFPKDEETFEALQELIDECKEELDELLIYRHIDCFDLTPKNINKYNGIKYLTELLNIESQDVIAVGDGVNDLPMFTFADIALGIIKEGSGELDVDYTFTTIGQVLDFIKQNTL